MNIDRQKLAQVLSDSNKLEEKRKKKKKREREKRYDAWGRRQP